MTKDHMKAVLSGEKKLLPRSQVNFVSVNKYDEISVKNLYSKMLAREELKPYFPNTYPKGRQCDKAYFFNICATIFPDEIAELIMFANNQRYDKSGEA